MLDYEYPARLLALLYVGLFGIAISYSALFLVALTPSPRPITTQRKRYTWIAIALLTAGAFLYLPLRKYGFAECVGALDEVRGRDFMFGWLISIAFFGQLAVPVLSLLVGLRVYLKPSRYAKRVRGGYVLTIDVRDKYKPYPVVPRRQ